MEARLYAEDPAHEFLPSTGRLDHFVLPRGVRIDTGVEEGDWISPYYDPMIAKLIARGASREEAAGRLTEALQEVEVWPVRTNAGFLARAAADPDFRSGEVDTAFIPSRLDTLVPDPVAQGPLLVKAPGHQPRLLKRGQYIFFGPAAGHGKACGENIYCPRSSVIPRPPSPPSRAPFPPSPAPRLRR